MNRLGFFKRVGLAVVGLVVGPAAQAICSAGQKQSVRVKRLRGYPWHPNCRCLLLPYTVDADGNITFDGDLEVSGDVKTKA